MTPTRDCWQAVVNYKVPWVEFKNVPNHYDSPASMRGALRKLDKRGGAAC